MKNTYYIHRHYRLVITPDEIYVISLKNYRGVGNKLTAHLCNGYLRVKMNNIHRQVHHLVAEATLGPRPEGLVVNHIDGNRTNNRPENLEYITQAENIQHSIRIGTHVANDPTRHARYIDGRSLKENRDAYKQQWYES